MAKKRKVALPTEIGFDFIKGNFFRVISVDGAFGGLSPQGRFIHMGLYSERQPYPTKVIHEVAKNRVLGDELKDKRQSRRGFVRELEADVVMDLPAAIGLQSWLTGRIKEMADLHNLQVDLVTGKISPKAAEPPSGNNGKGKK